MAVMIHLKSSTGDTRLMRLLITVIHNRELVYETVGGTTPYFLD